MAPGGIEPPHADSKSAALSTELRGLAASVPDRGCPNRVGRGRQAILSSLAVAVAQLVEPRVVVPVVGGSSPLRHPSLLVVAGGALVAAHGTPDQGAVFVGTYVALAAGLAKLDS